MSQVSLAKRPTGAPATQCPPSLHSEDTATEAKLLPTRPISARPQTYHRASSVGGTTSSGWSSPVHAEPSDWLNDTFRKLDADCARSYSSGSTGICGTAAGSAPRPPSARSFGSGSRVRPPSATCGSMGGNACIPEGDPLQLSMERQYNAVKGAATGTSLCGDRPSSAMVVTSERPASALERTGNTAGSSVDRSVFVNDLERYRLSFERQLKDQLVAVQDAISKTGAGEIYKCFLHELKSVRAREDELQKELDRTRAHLEELLHLNAVLRQQTWATDQATARHAEELSQTASRLTSAGEALQSSGEHIDSSVANAADLVSKFGPLLDHVSQLSNPGIGTLIESTGDRIEASVADGTQQVRDEMRKLLDNQPREAELLSGFRRLLAEQPRDNSGFLEDVRRLLVQELRRLRESQGHGSSDELRRLTSELQELRAAVGPELQEDVRRAIADAWCKAAPPGGWQAMGNSLEILEDKLSHVATCAQRVEEVGARTSDRALRIQDVSSKMLSSIIDLTSKVAKIAGTLDSIGEPLAKLAETKECEKCDKFEADIKRMRAELETSRRRLTELEKNKVDPLKFLHLLKDVEKRGNVSIDLKTGDVEVLREIPFVARKSNEEPIAEFSDSDVAKSIIRDIKDVWSVVPVEMCVEGHTKGGETAFWQSLADNRATLIVSILKDLGVDPKFVKSKGLPGRRGKNKVGVVVKLDIFPDD